MQFFGVKKPLRRKVLFAFIDKLHYNSDNREDLAFMNKETKDPIPKKVFRVAYAVNFVIQAGVSAVCPAGLIILGGWLLTKRCHVGKWAMVLAIVLGIIIGVYSMFYYIIKTMNSFDPTQSNSKGGEKDDRSSGTSERK